MDELTEFDEAANAVIDDIAKQMLVAAEVFMAIARAALVQIRHLSEAREQMVRDLAERAGVTQADIRTIVGTTIITWNRRQIDVLEHLEAA